MDRARTINKRTYILLLNWNGWKDTVECLESVLANTRGAPIVLVDNNSSDDSVDRIGKYLRSGGVDFSVLGEDEASSPARTFPADDGVAVTIIRNKSNYGFAGGNNVGIRYVLKLADASFVWLLNTDTVIDGAALSELIARASTDDKIAFTGSVIRHYDRRDLVQCYGGGTVYKHLGITRLCMKNSAVEALGGGRKPRVDYLLGASILANLDAIREIGLMDDSYFFLGEDIEWQYRARKMGWKIEVAEGSYVYHKTSASTKDNRHVYLYYLNRGGITFIKRFYGLFTASVASVSLLCITVIKNITRPRNMVCGIKGIFEGLIRGADTQVGQGRLW